MTDEPETVEVPLSTVRNAADLLGYNARIGYSNNDTEWADKFHAISRRLHDQTDDDWDSVGIERFHDGWYGDQ